MQTNCMKRPSLRLTATTTYIARRRRTMVMATLTRHRMSVRPMESQNVEFVKKLGVVAQREAGGQNVGPLDEERSTRAW